MVRVRYRRGRGGVAQGHLPHTPPSSRARALPLARTAWRSADGRLQVLAHKKIVEPGWNTGRQGADGGAERWGKRASSSGAAAPRPAASPPRAPHAEEITMRLDLLHTLTGLGAQWCTGGPAVQRLRTVTK